MTDPSDPSDLPPGLPVGLDAARQWLARVSDGTWTYRPDPTDPDRVTVTLDGVDVGTLTGDVADALIDTRPIISHLARTSDRLAVLLQAAWAAMDGQQRAVAAAADPGDVPGDPDTASALDALLAAAADRPADVIRAILDATDEDPDHT